MAITLKKLSPPRNIKNKKASPVKSKKASPAPRKKSKTVKKASPTPSKKSTPVKKHLLLLLKKCPQKLKR